MEINKKPSGLFARIDSEILHAIGLGALIATVGMGISLAAGTVAIAGTTAAIAMGIGAMVGIASMIGSVMLQKKAERIEQKAPQVVIIQAQAQGQGLVHQPEIEITQENTKFRDMVAQRSHSSELAR